jgi:hypothetical protein
MQPRPGSDVRRYHELRRAADPVIFFRPPDCQRPAAVFPRISRPRHFLVPGRKGYPQITQITQMRKKNRDFLIVINDGKSRNRAMSCDSE